MNLNLAFLFLINFTIGQTLKTPVCDSIANTDRLDCFPEYGASEEACESRGCCWTPPLKQKLKQVKVDEPYCFYPKNFPGYDVVNRQRLSLPNKAGYLYSLAKNSSTFRPKEILQLEAKIIFETDKRLRGKT